ncbi:helix-turn-helix transcriptional regulator [Fibrivirga algicola]|uniref:helix-turn-helix transcriptional regulator n=1 Tax=Fibrivirga algicola TaxID=2950420 RepID=UPI00286E0723|nr:helix-turn-helix transcriptional regulator [Fibrivirga algicola]
MNQNEQQRFYQLLGENIKKHRNIRELTQEQLAFAIDLTRTSVVNIEQGRQRPPLYLLVEIAQKLHVTLETLVPTESAFSNGTMLDANTLKAVPEKDVTKLTSFLSDFMKRTNSHEQETSKTD